MAVCFPLIETPVVPEAPTFEQHQQLQAQVDLLQERLNFVIPQLGLINVVQDYFKRIECEAAVQLLRLEKSQFISAKAQQNAVIGSPAAPDHQMVNWLNSITNVMTALQNDSALGSTKAPVAEDSNEVAVHPKVQQTATPRTKESKYHDLKHAQEVRTRAGQPSKASAGIDESSMAGLSAKYKIDELRPDDFYHEPVMEGCGFGDPLPTMQSSKSGLQTVSDMIQQVRIPDNKQLVTSKPRNAPEATSEPGTGGTSELDQASNLDGFLAAAKGSWAKAYCEATGARRDALSLLCSSGIVTARELSDDLTVIGRDHIDECVEIASEMLRTRPCEFWEKQPAAAKKFFEDELTHRYQRRFGGGQSS